MTVPPERVSELFSDYSNERLVSASSDMSNREIALDVCRREDVTLKEAEQMVNEDPERWRAIVMRRLVS